MCDLYARLEGSIDVQERSCYGAGWAVLELSEGRSERAFAIAEEVITSQRLVGAWQQTVKLAFAIAIEAALALGETDRVERLLAMVERQPPGLQTPLVTAHAHRFRGRMADSGSAAEVAFSAAERTLRERAIPFWLAVAQLEHAEARLVHGGGDATGLAEEARETFARLRAAPWIARADAIAATSAAVPAETPRPTA